MKKKRKNRRGSNSGIQKTSVEVASSSRSSFRDTLSISLILAAVILVVYAPVRHYGFLSWDDPLYVAQNVEVSQGLRWDGLVWAFTTGHSANWHPLTWLSHMTDVQLFGKSAGLHHLTSVLLHMANTLLLFWALCRMTGAWQPSAMVAALFAVHPVHVESVAWVAERKDVLSTFFWMLTLHAYISYVRRPCFRRYSAILLFFALGLMSKPMLVTLPLVLLLLDYWPLARVQMEARHLRVWRQLAVEKIPLFILAALSSIATVLAQWRGGAIGNFEIFPLSVRILNGVASYFAYVSKMFWPRNLAAFYPYESLSGWFVAGCFLILISVTLLGIHLTRKYRWFLVGWLWYLGTLVPVLGIMQVGPQARADRYTYVPLIGLFIMLAWGVPALLGSWQRRSVSIQVAAGILVVGVLTVAARNQVRYWETDLALWQHTVQATGNNYFSRMLLGSALADHGDLAEAAAQYTESLRLNPQFAEAHNGLGAVFFREGRLNEAMEHYTEAVRIKPGLAEPHSNRGAILWLQGKGVEAMAEFQTALKIKPDSAEVRYSYGFALAEQGNISEAINQFREALRINPEHVEAYNKLGNALASQGKFGKAIDQYAKALSIKSDFAGAHNNMAIALASQNRYPEAIFHFREALRLDPTLEDARVNLATALEEQEKSRQAVP